jgi:hypothetical protein
MDGPYEISNDKKMKSWQGQYLTAAIREVDYKNDQVVGSDIVDNIETGNFQQGKDKENGNAMI